MYNNTGNSHVIVFHELKFIACVFWDLPFVLLMPSCIMLQIELYSCTKRTFTKTDAFSISTSLSFYFRKMGNLLFETREKSRKIRNLKFLKKWEIKEILLQNNETIGIMEHFIFKKGFLEKQMLKERSTRNN